MNFPEKILNSEIFERTSHITEREKWESAADARPVKPSWNDQRRAKWCVSRASIMSSKKRFTRQSSRINSLRGVTAWLSPLLAVKVSHILSDRELSLFFPEKCEINGDRFDCVGRSDDIAERETWLWTRIIPVVYRRGNHGLPWWFSGGSYHVFMFLVSSSLFL